MTFYVTPEPDLHKFEELLDKKIRIMGIGMQDDHIAALGVLASFSCIGKPTAAWTFGFVGGGSFTIPSGTRFTISVLD